MSTRFLAVALTALAICSGVSPALAQAKFGSRVPPEARPYHACLYAHWIENYCRFSWWGSGGTFASCLISNGACECAYMNEGYLGPEIDSACRAVSPRHL
jgi:hypothetical protein